MLLVIFLFVSFFTTFSQSGILVFYMGSFSFFILSIRFVFLLEIKTATIIGILTCGGSGIGEFIFMEYFFTYFSIEERIQVILESKIIIFVIFLLNLIIFFLNRRTKPKEEVIVKRNIIEFGKKIARLKIKDISEKSNVDTSTVFKVLNEMIRNQEIYAEYFKSSKTVAFNQIANLENIDLLMKLYEDWEHQKLKKT